MSELWFLSPSDFLGRLPPADRRDLLGVADARLARNGDFVFQAGSPGETVYILERGRVKIFGMSSLGKEVILWFCFPGEVFGIAEMPRGGPREVYAQACSDCRLYAVPQRLFKDFLIDHPSTAMLVIELLSCRLRILGDMVKNLTADDVTTRLAKLLIRLSARYGQRVTPAHLRLSIKLTHQELADMIGATRPTVTGVLSELRRSGVIDVEDHHLCIHRPEMLERLVADARALN
ncbi:Crp/Fnr family transcriptional regulator [Sulfurifustis variabilis]|uniref:Crp/Fnr family transcriptional regulator n=1 Tax=Sulfurifustis variabilis TaxID=1675686 RepID=A0A1B4VD35_9GAMM|nr:Crp/Fnr family transcriptional regulator [Sulfurifustis variabilis]BAU50161.1 Crp/Fnr family transcriptional regulator [Sulfurifustis variabilis]